LFALTATNCAGFVELLLLTAFHLSPVDAQSRRDSTRFKALGLVNEVRINKLANFVV